MSYSKLKADLLKTKSTWLVTGVAGFIGSNLLETLLKLNQNVVGIDNLSTGSMKNVEMVKSAVTPQQWNDFSFTKADVCDFDACKKALVGVDYVLHQAALGSVPRSIKDPINSNNSNVTGFLNMLVASKDAGVNNFVYAASSSTYGDHPALPKVEENIGKPLSPYAVTKYVNELYADVFYKTYGFKSIGLRYFNVFGPRQNPSGAYAAVIPKWTLQMINSEEVYINGDGETSRDFCYIENVVQMNLLAATTNNDCAFGEVFNTALNDRTSLNELFSLIKSKLQKIDCNLEIRNPIYKEFREGDVRHSQADISKAKNILKYNPSHKISEGIELAVDWYVKNLGVS